MKADWRAQLEAEFEAGQGYKPNKADWLDGRWSGLKAVREDVDDAAARQDRPCRRGPEGDRQPHHRRCRRASTSTAPSSASSTTAAR